MLAGYLEQHLPHLIHVRSVGDTDLHPDALLLPGSPALVGYLGVGDHRVGQRDLDVVPGQQPRGAQADVGDSAALPAVEDDVVAHLIGSVGEDEDARE